MITRFRPRGSRPARVGGPASASAPTVLSTAPSARRAFAAPDPSTGERAAADPAPFVEDDLAGLVDAAYRRFVGRAPTRAERLLDVAELQARPGVATLLSVLFEPDASPSRAGGPGG